MSFKVDYNSANNLIAPGSYECRIVEAFTNATAGGTLFFSVRMAIRDDVAQPHKGRIKERWDLLDKYGYYPFDEIKGESVSRTMECAYDDWCAGMMAEGLGFKDDAEFFFKRAENWRNGCQMRLREASAS